MHGTWRRQRQRISDDAGVHSRGLGWLFMFLGLTLIAGPANVVADILPPIGRVTRAVTPVVAVSRSLL